MAPDVILPPSSAPSAETMGHALRWRSNLQARMSELALPNFLVQWAFYLSVFSIPFARLYIPGTGDRLGVRRVIQMLIVAAMLSRPRVCLRYVPTALFWFVAYCAVRVAAGFWLAPDFSALWWPTTLEWLQFLLPWFWVMFNVLQYPNFSYRGVWALVLGTSLCSLLHVAGIGTVAVDNGIEGRSSIFGQNANEIGEIYGVALVALVALGLFRNTKPSLRLLVFPLAGLVGTALAKTGSRTGVLLATLGLLVLLPQTRAFVPRLKRYLTLLLVTAVLAGVMYQIPTVFKRFAPAGSSSVTQREARARMIPVLWEMFLRSPLYGSGPDQYQNELTRRAMPYLADKQQTISSHNLPLLLLVETGIIGFLLFAVGLGKALVSAWRSRVGSCGLLPLAWLLPLTIAGLTISNPIYGAIFWLTLAYALAGRNGAPLRPQELAVQGPPIGLHS